MNRLLVVCVALVFGGSDLVVAGDQVQYPLDSGEYVLVLEIPSGPQDETTKDIPGTLTVSGASVAFATRSPDGTPVTFLGKIIRNRLLLWFSLDERGSIITYHLSGEIVKTDEARGRVTIFETHERVAQGTWKLVRKTNKPNEAPEDPARQPADPQQ